MSQYTLRTIDPLTKTGTQLATDLNNWSLASETWHSDVSRPGYAVTGTIWVDTTSDPVHQVKWYTGDADINFLDFHDTSDTATFKGVAYQVFNATRTWMMELEGSDHLRVRDVTGSVSPFVIEKATPANTLYLDSAGSGSVSIRGVSPSGNASLFLMGTAASIAIAERATPPTADSTYGKLWIKNDNTVWFQDGAGTDRQIITRAINIVSFIVAAGDETTAITTGTAKVKFRMPYAFTVTDVRGSLSTAGGGAALLTVDVNESGTTILSTKLTFDAGETTTTTAATPRVISDTALADDAEISIDVDVADTNGTAKGLKVAIIGYKTS